MGFLEILGMVGSTLLSTLGSMGGGGVPTNERRMREKNIPEWQTPAGARQAAGVIRNSIDPGSANAGSAMDGGARLQALQNIRAKMGGM